MSRKDLIVAIVVGGTLYKLVERLCLPKLFALYRKFCAGLFTTP